LAGTSPPVFSNYATLRTSPLLFIFLATHNQLSVGSGDVVITANTGPSAAPRLVASESGPSQAYLNEYAQFLLLGASLQGT